MSRSALESLSIHNVTSASQNETRLETWISHTPGQANLLKKHYYYIYRYYYSWICHYGRSFYNGALIGSGKEEKIIWYDTYPFEFCEFILDKALSTGTYLQALSANDAFYNRETSHIDNGGDKRSDHGDQDVEPAEIICKCKYIICVYRGTEKLLEGWSV